MSYVYLKIKVIIIPPPTNQILCDKPKELYVIDTTKIPIDLYNNINEKIYLLSILDYFSKFEYNYIIKNKGQNTVSNNVK